MPPNRDRIGNGSPTDCIVVPSAHYSTVICGSCGCGITNGFETKVPSDESMHHRRVPLIDVPSHVKYQDEKVVYLTIVQPIDRLVYKEGGTCFGQLALIVQPIDRLIYHEHELDLVSSVTFEIARQGCCCPRNRLTDGSANLSSEMVLPLCYKHCGADSIVKLIKNRKFTLSNRYELFAIHTHNNSKPHRRRQIVEQITVHPTIS